MLLGGAGGHAFFGAEAQELPDEVDTISMKRLLELWPTIK